MKTPLLGVRKLDHIELEFKSYGLIYPQERCFRPSVFPSGIEQLGNINRGRGRID